MAFPWDRGDHQVGFPGGVAVGQAADAMADLPGDGVGPVVAAGTDDHRLAGHREPAGQAPSLFPGAAEDADDESVDRWGFALSHGLHPVVLRWSTTLSRSVPCGRRPIRERPRQPF